MRLYVSGGYHIDLKSEERQDEIVQALEGEPDVVFTESKTEPDDDREKFYNLIAAPLILLSLLTWALFLKSFGTLFGSDKEVVQSFTEIGDVDEVKVDRPVTPLIADARKPWAFANWVVILFVLLTFASSGLSIALLNLVLLGAVVFLSFVAGTAAPRNYAMAMNIIRAANNGGYERGVLVVGGEHSEEVKRHIRKTSNEIDIVDPKNSG